MNQISATTPTCATLARHLRDPDRPAQLVRAPFADDDLADRPNGQSGPGDGFLRPPRRPRGPVRTGPSPRPIPMR